MERNEIRLEEIVHAFSPAKEIDDPKLFVGRKEEIKRVLEFLLLDGSFLVIHGLRGVGKSSIALQLKRIAEGRNELVNALSLTQYGPSDVNYLTIYYRIDSRTKHIDLVLMELTRQLKRVVYGDSEIKEKTIRKGGRGELSVLGIAHAGGEMQSTEKYIPIASEEIFDQFREILIVARSKLHRRHTGILIILDEFDVLHERKGFSSLVKVISSEGFVKFAVVGISSTVAELMDDHESIGRQILPVKVPVMKDYELFEILRRAEYLMRNKIKFEDEAAWEIAKKSSGFPYFTHLIGYESAKLAFELGKGTVTQDDVNRVFRRLSEGKLQTLYEETYSRAIKHSEQREILLKLFSEVPEEVIPTEKVYRVAKELGVTNPSQLMQALTAPLDNGRPPILIKVRDRHYRFSDPVFKVYARLRTFKH